MPAVGDLLFNAVHEFALFALGFLDAFFLQGPYARGIRGRGTRIFECFADPGNIAEEKPCRRNDPEGKYGDIGSVHTLKYKAFMRSMAIFLFLFCAAAPARADGSVEIIVNGVRYQSIDAYKALKKGGPHTIVLPQKPAVDPETSRALDTISLEHGIGRVMADFNQNWDDPMPKFTISPTELEDHIRSLVEGRKGPVLLIAEPGKLKVAVYGPRDLEK